MDTELLFQLLEVAATSVVAGYAVIRLHGRTRVFFLLTIFCFFLSRMIHVESERFHEWARHIPFYAGQIFCYVFLNRIIWPEKAANRKTEKASPSPADSEISSEPSMFIGVVTGTSTTWQWFDHATAQGLEHILTLPLMLLIVGGLLAHFPFIVSQERKRVIRGFLFAMVPLTLIHLGEFSIESQHWLPWETIIEQMETALYISAMIIFLIALRNLHRFNTTNTHE